MNSLLSGLALPSCVAAVECSPGLWEILTKCPSAQLYLSPVSLYTVMELRRARSEPAPHQDTRNRLVSWVGRAGCGLIRNSQVKNEMVIAVQSRLLARPSGPSNAVLE